MWKNFDVWILILYKRCEILSCSYTYIYIYQIIIKVTSFLLATLCHVFIHLHTKYEGTGLKTKIFCCRQNWMIKNKSCDFVALFNVYSTPETKFRG
jgi:hypothetical protein